MKYSLAQQHQALMHCVALVGQSKAEDDTILEAAEEAVNSFRFLRDHRDAYVALLKVLQAFPDAQIEILEGVDEYHNGSGH